MAVVGTCAKTLPSIMTMSRSERVCSINWSKSSIPSSMALLFSAPNSAANKADRMEGPSRALRRRSRLAQDTIGLRLRNTGVPAMGQNVRYEVRQGSAPVGGELLR